MSQIGAMMRSVSNMTCDTGGILALRPADFPMETPGNIFLGSDGNCVIVVMRPLLQTTRVPMGIVSSEFRTCSIAGHELSELP